MCLKLLRQSAIAGLKPGSRSAAVADRRQDVNAAWWPLVGVGLTSQASRGEKGGEAAALAHSHSLALLSPSR